MAINPKLLEAVIVYREAYLAGENYERLSPMAHTMKVLEMLHLDSSWALEGVQVRVQCGLEPLDVVELAIAGKLPEAMAASRIQVDAEIAKNNAAPRPKPIEHQGGPLNMPSTGSSY
jgi:hypothetical protein